MSLLKLLQEVNLVNTFLLGLLYRFLALVGATRLVGLDLASIGALTHSPLGVIESLRGLYLLIGLSEVDEGAIEVVGGHLHVLQALKLRSVATLLYALDTLLELLLSSRVDDVYSLLLGQSITIGVPPSSLSKKRVAHHTWQILVPIQEPESATWSTVARQEVKLLATGSEAVLDS